MLIVSTGYQAPARLGTSTPHARGVVSFGEARHPSFQEQQSASGCGDSSLDPQIKNVSSYDALTG
jgi:hypothetical protein